MRIQLKSLKSSRHWKSCNRHFTTREREVTLLRESIPKIILKTRTPEWTAEPFVSYGE